jgi:phosphatidate phosphatase APP1
MQKFKERRFRVHYLSKSESNLYQVIADFIAYHRLPKGALLLSPHLKWNQLLKPNKGKDYKSKHLRELLQNLPDKKFILLGDDTQRDMDVYTEIVNEFKSQIRMVFIRQTRIKRTELQETKWEALNNTGVESYYFDDSDDPSSAITKINEL